MCLRVSYMIERVHALALIKACLQAIGKVWCNFETAPPWTALYTALVALALLLIVLCRLPSAQTPPGNELAPTPTAPDPLERLPSAPGPLETLPSPQEQLLAPVPQQFNWLEREVPSNPLLESLLSLREPTGLTVTA